MSIINKLIEVISGKIDNSEEETKIINHGLICLANVDKLKGLIPDKTIKIHELLLNLIVLSRAGNLNAWQESKLKLKELGVEVSIGKNEKTRSLLELFPRANAEFLDVENSISSYVSYESVCPSKFNIKDTAIATFGSCFALNISKELNSIGIPIINFAAAEEAPIEKIPETVEASLTQLEAYLKKHNRSNLILIITGGIGLEIVLKNGEVIPTYKVKEKPMLIRKIKSCRPINSEKIETIIKKCILSLSKIALTEVYLSVSPVPAEATFGKKGLLVDNFESKIAIREAFLSITKTLPNCSYVPNYELITQYAHHARIWPFGSNDGHPRHVSQALVKLCVLLFIKHSFGKETYEILKNQYGISNLNQLFNNS